MLEPATGCCSRTTPDWLSSDVGRSRRTTRNPASRRALAAAASSCPTTSGTVTGRRIGPVRDVDANACAAVGERSSCWSLGDDDARALARVDVAHDRSQNGAAQPAQTGDGGEPPDVRHTDSGRRYEVLGLDMVCVRNGRIVEHWALLDADAMRDQLGL